MGSPTRWLSDPKSVNRWSTEVQRSLRPATFPPEPEVRTIVAAVRTPRRQYALPLPRRRRLGRPLVRRPVRAGVGGRRRAVQVGRVFHAKRILSTENNEYRLPQLPYGYIT